MYRDNELKKDKLKQENINKITDFYSFSEYPQFSVYNSKKLQWHYLSSTASSLAMYPTTDATIYID